MNFDSPFQQLLVVEDDPGHWALVRRALATLSPLQIHRAATLAEAQEHIARVQPEIALVDLGLPDGSGSDLVEVAAGRFPVVVMTASRSEETIVDLMRRGIMDFIVKSNEAYQDLPHTLVRAHSAWRHQTERRRAEAALEQREADYRFVVEHAADAILSVSSAGHITFASPATSRVLGFSPDQLLGKPVTDLVHADDVPRFAGTLYRCQNRGEDGTSVEIRQRHTGRYLDVSYGARSDGDRVVLLFRDATARTQAEFEKAKLDGELRRAQRLNTVGTLASGIAHDFNNVLSPIQIYAECLRDALTRGSREREDVEQILLASHRATELVKRLLLFAQGAPAEQRPIQLPALAEEAMALISAGVGARVKLQRDYAGELPAVLGDATQLHQMLMNLCTNAAQAIDGTGTITLSVDVAGQMVRLRVRDDGTGMLPEVREHMFDPFFTTRSKAKNTGLGLAVTQRIVRDHGGTIACTSKLGEGTAFEILLPATEQKTESASPSRARTQIQGGGRLLIVDDEKMVRAAMVTLLIRAGYDVVDVQSAADALAVLETGHRFDLLISDQVMRDTTGAELATELVRRGHKIPFVLISGLGQFRDMKGIDHVRATLAKPFTAQQLTALIESILRTDDNADSKQRRESGRQRRDAAS